MSVVKFKWGCPSGEPCVQLSLLWSGLSLECRATTALSHVLSTSSSCFLDAQLVVASQRFHFAYSCCFTSVLHAFCKMLSGTLVHFQWCWLLCHCKGWTLDITKSLHSGKSKVFTVKNLN